MQGKKSENRSDTPNVYEEVVENMEKIGIETLASCVFEASKMLFWFEKKKKISETHYNSFLGDARASSRETEKKKERSIIIKQLWNINIFCRLIEI